MEQVAAPESFEVEVEESLAIIRADIAAFNADADERIAIACNGLTTEELAIRALQQPDTIWGKHATARAYLKQVRSQKTMFAKVGR